MTSAGFLANSNHIARCETKPYPKPLPATAVSQGFENYAFPKLVAELRSDNLIIRSKAVLAARELLLAPEKHIQCIAVGVTPALVALLQEDSLQEQVAVTVQQLMARQVGCRDVLQHGGLPQLLLLMDRPSAAVKDAAYGALLAAAGFEPCRNALIQKQGALSALVRHAQQEEPQRQAQALDLLLHCMQVRHNQEALSQLIAVVHAVPKLAAIISNNAPEPVVLRAVKLLAALASTQQDARIQAVDAGSIPVLLKLVSSGVCQVACAAAKALMMITLAKEAKIALHQAHGMPILLEALTRHQQQPTASPAGPDDYTTNVLQALKNAAEYPACRAELLKSRAGELLKGLAADSSEGRVKEAAAQALRIIGCEKGRQ